MANIVITNSIAGGGGGGISLLLYLPDRPNGKARGKWQGEGGDGEKGISLTLRGFSSLFWALGGGGIGDIYGTKSWKLEVSKWS